MPSEAFRAAGSEGWWRRRESNRRTTMFLSTISSGPLRPPQLFHNLQAIKKRPMLWAPLLSNL